MGDDTRPISGTRCEQIESGTGDFEVLELMARPVDPVIAGEHLDAPMNAEQASAFADALDGVQTEMTLATPPSCRSPPGKRKYDRPRSKQRPVKPDLRRGSIRGSIVSGSGLI